MNRPRPLPRQKAAKLFERARGLARDGALADAAALLAEAAPRLDAPEPEKLLVQCLVALGEGAQALEALERAHKRFPKEPSLAIDLAVALARLGEHGRAAAAFRAGEPAMRGAPELLGLYAHTLLQAGNPAEALKQARRAAELAPGEKTLVLLCTALARAGALDEAVRVASKLEGAGELVDAGREVGAQAAMMLGDVGAAVALWSLLSEVPRAALPVFALALELEGEPSRADAALAKAADDDATKLFSARIALHRGELARCLEALKDVALGDDVALTRAQALRRLGRLDEAAAELVKVSAAPPKVVAAAVATERGHVLAEQRQFELAGTAYEAALKADPDNSEAQAGLSLTRRQLSWREAVEQRALEQAEAARLEVASLKRLLAARQKELDAAQQELAKAPKPVDAEGAVDAALGENRARVPGAVRSMLVEAEGTAAPSAAAILYLGALERLLHVLLVERFTLTPDAREAFLKGAVRERRAGKPEYFDRFVQAFDPASADRTPALGEMARALSRRGNDYLAPFAAHLQRTLSLDAAALDGIAKHVERLAKTLRDPLVHGKADQVGPDAVAALKRTLFVELDGRRGGMFGVLLGALRDV